ncbi:MAG TPA: AAA family ATPase [Dictyobacter sp.]|jgi:dephospho-CoA kinase|nr:AAA family ATPase [Dictyobacter sp.]
MAMTTFVLGRPGSGKTTAFRYVQELIQHSGWKVTRIREYTILQEMFLHDLQQKRFRAIPHGGFDVIDFSVLNEALAKLEDQIRNYEQRAAERELIIVEFARDNYQTALRQFSPAFLQHVNILFVEAELDICIQRIKQRVLNCAQEDNHNVSEAILREYYGYDNREYMRTEAIINRHLQQLDTRHQRVVQFIENNGPLVNLYTGVEKFVADILSQHEQQPVSSKPHLVMSTLQR